jgi:hypothetical protein
MARPKLNTLMSAAAAGDPATAEQRGGAERVIKRELHGSVPASGEGRLADEMRGRVPAICACILLDKRQDLFGDALQLRHRIAHGGESGR